MGHGFKKSVLPVCVFLVGFITQRPRYLIIYTSNQNWRIACLLKSVITVRKHVTAPYILSLACHHCHLSALLAPMEALFLRAGGSGGSSAGFSRGQRQPLWLGSLRIPFAEHLTKLNGEDPKRMLLRWVSLQVSQMLWSSFFWGINYLLAHFSKPFFTDAIFHLFSLVLMHTLSYFSLRNIGTENFYLFQYWILLHDVIAVPATTQFPPPLYIHLLLSYYPGKFSLLSLCRLTRAD